MAHLGRRSLGSAGQNLLLRWRKTWHLVPGPTGTQQKTISQKVRRWAGPLALIRASLNLSQAFVASAVASHGRQRLGGSRASESIELAEQGGLSRRFVVDVRAEYRLKRSPGGLAKFGDERLDEVPIADTIVQSPDQGLG